MNRLPQIIACASVALALSGAASAQVVPPSQAPSTGSSVAVFTDNADVLFAHWDKNHDKMLSPEEFRSGWSELRAAASAQLLHTQFIALDTERNGCLSAAEYAHMELISNAGKAAPPMSQFDTEKNQCLDFKEYTGVVSYMLSHK